MFYNKLIPLLVANSAINVNTIETATYPVQPTRTLNVQMLALFDALTENSNSAITAFTIKMQCDYTYIILGTAFPVDVPVLMITPTQITVADHGKSITDLITAGINNWMQSNNPQTNAGLVSLLLC
jgi:hypothetical protein